MRDALGILVHSSDYFDHVAHLAYAALAKGKRVHIHLLRRGVLFISEKAFDRLVGAVHITVCEESALELQQIKAFEPIAPVHLTSCSDLPVIFGSCDRWVAF